MLYCSNPLCLDPFNPDSVKTCLSCGQPCLDTIFHHRYKVIRMLGEGGFGRTYQALDTEHMDHPCVIKQLTVRKPEALEKAKALFQEEAKRLYELGKHTQIPSFLAHFAENYRLYLVQEYIEGKNLYAEFEKEGKFDEGKVIELLQNFLPVLQFIHEHKIIHRDIKPENIMRRDSDGQLVLIDFGIAKQLASTGAYSNGTLIGTPGYAPAEQIAYGQVYPSSDLYSLGITCIRLMTGEFMRNDFHNFPQQSQRWWQFFPVRLSNETAKILDRLIEKDIDKRYQSAEDVLKDVIHSRGNNSPPTSPIERQSVTVADKREVGGIILKEPAHKELVRIARISVPLIEERLGGRRINYGSSFLYKQSIALGENRSRCYFMTNLHVITGVLLWQKYLIKSAGTGQTLEDIKGEFVALWNKKEYLIDKFIIPNNTLHKNLGDTKEQHLDFALFHIDIESTESLDFFGIPAEADLDLGDKLYAFGYRDGLNLSMSDGMVNHLYRGAIAHNILIDGGNSGGPTVNELGAIVGISTRGYASSVVAGLNFSLDVDFVLEQLTNSDNLEVLTVSEHLQTLKQKIKENIPL